MTFASQISRRRQKQIYIISNFLSPLFMNLNISPHRDQCSKTFLPFSDNFLNMAQSRPHFPLFSSFSHSNTTV